MPTVLTVSALDLGADKLVNYMKKVCRGYAVTGGRAQVQVRYPAMLDPSAGDRPGGSIRVGAQRLDALIRTIPGPKVVLGYSQGAQVVGTWLRMFTARADAPDPAMLSFILIGNPERKYGQQPWTLKTTPNHTQYWVRDVTRRGDNWSDYDPKRHGKNKVLAMFGSVHTNYWNVDLEAPPSVVSAVGNTTYEIVP